MLTPWHVVAMPEVASLAVQPMTIVWSAVYDAGCEAKATAGRVASRLMMTDCVAVPPPLVAEQVTVVPTVSAEMSAWRRRAR